MKKSILAIGAFAMLFFAGCGSSPEGAVKDFYKALAKGDKELLEKSTTPQAFTFVSMALGAMPATEKAGLQDGVEIVKVEKQAEHIVVVESKSKANGKIHKDTVVEIDGTWKVDAKK